jgi:hypothetical protein
MEAIKITFKEPAKLKIFTDQNIAGPWGPSQEIDVAAGETWYAPTSQGNQLMMTANKQIPVVNNSFATFHDLGPISRTTDEEPRYTQIAAVNIGTIVPRAHIPQFEAAAIEERTLDTTHSDYL